MKIYIDTLLAALIVVYIVDLSGFTQSWRGALARMLHIREMKSIKPLDCSQCMTWWITLIYCIAEGQWSIYTTAWCALLAFLSIPFGQIMIFIREWIMNVINRLMP